MGTFDCYITYSALDNSYYANADLNLGNPKILIKLTEKEKECHLKSLTSHDRYQFELIDNLNFFRNPYNKEEVYPLLSTKVCKTHSLKGVFDAVAKATPFSSLETKGIFETIPGYMTLKDIKEFESTLIKIAKKEAKKANDTNENINENIDENINEM